MSSRRHRPSALAVTAAILACTESGLAFAEKPATSSPGAWDVEPFKNGYVAVSRSSDQRTALLFFCTLLGTRDFVYAYDGRDLTPAEVPVSETVVRAAPTVTVMGLSVASGTVTFDTSGSVERMHVPLPKDFNPPESGAITVELGPDATQENGRSIVAAREGLADSIRIAFKNCI